MLSVVKEASSELVKRDQSLDVASENSLIGSAYVSTDGMTFLFALLRMPFEAGLVKPLPVSALISLDKASEPTYWPLGLLSSGFENFDVQVANSGSCCWIALPLSALLGRGQDLEEQNHFKKPIKRVNKQKTKEYERCGRNYWKTIY